jgi:hypothetical protein
MKLGILTAPLPDTHLKLVAYWAAQSEFKALAIAFWPRSAAPMHPYAGTNHINFTSALVAED